MKEFECISLLAHIRNWPCPFFIYLHTPSTGSNLCSMLRYLVTASNSRDFASAAFVTISALQAHFYKIFI